MVAIPVPAQLGRLFCSNERIACDQLLKTAWQKIEQKSGKAVYQCRATGDSKFQKAAACEKAGAVKPK